MFNPPMLEMLLSFVVCFCRPGFRNFSNKRLETEGDSAVSAFARDASSSFRKHLEVGALYASHFTI